MCRRNLIVLVVFLLSFTMISAGFAATKIRVGYIVDINMTPYFVALEKGYFAERGLEIETKMYVSGKDAYTALKGGLIDIFQNMGANAVAKFHSQGLGIYMIRAWTLPHFKILVRKDAPYKSIKDLKGKNYAVTSFAGTTYAISSMAFHASGMDIQKDVQIKTFPPSVMQVELGREGGSLDGCVLWEPLVTKALATGNIQVLVDPGKLYVDKFQKRFFHGAIGCMKEFFEVNRPAVKKYIEAIGQGITYTLENKDEASRIHAKDWKGYTWQDVAKIRASWGDGWIRADINPDQIQEMQFMYDKMVELTKYFKVRPQASEFMIKP